MLDGNSDAIWCAGACVTKLGTARHLWCGLDLQRRDLPDIISGTEYFPNACMVSRDVLLEVPFDDINFPRGWAEVDFGLRILDAGFSAATVTRAIERHHVGYRGPLTRPGPPGKVYEQAKSRILFRKRYLFRISDWLIFWLVVFPPSTVVYTLRIMRGSHARLRTLAAYFHGTVDGIRQPLTSFPNVEYSTKAIGHPNSVASGSEDIHCGPSPTAPVGRRAALGRKWRRSPSATCGYLVLRPRRRLRQGRQANPASPGSSLHFE